MPSFYNAAFALYQEVFLGKACTVFCIKLRLNRIQKHFLVYISSKLGTVSLRALVKFRSFPVNS